MASEHITTGQGAGIPRLTVHLWSGLRRFAEGQEAVEVDAATIGAMIAALKSAYPALSPALDAGVSVAVDGRIIAASLDEQIGRAHV